MGDLTTPKNWLPGLNPGFGPVPYTTWPSIEFFKAKLVPFVVSWGIFLVIFLSLVFLIVGGIMWTIGGGNKEGLAKAKGTVTYALVGLVLGLGSFIILNILGNFFNSNLLGK